jgi:hypothetical protein
VVFNKKARARLILRKLNKLFSFVLEKLELLTCRLVFMILNRLKRPRYLVYTLVIICLFAFLLIV